MRSLHWPGCARIHVRGGSPRGEFPAVPQQIFQHSAEQSRIAFGLQVRRDRELRLSRRIELGELLGHRARHLAQIDVLALDLRGGVMRESSSRSSISADIRSGRGAYALEMLLAGFIQLLGIILEQRLAESIDAPQRRPQIVRNGVAEGFQLPVRRFQLRIRPA